VVKAGTSVTVTPVRKAHLPSLHRAFEAIAGRRRYFVRTQAPSRGRLRKIVLDADKRDLPFYVAVDEGEVVGWVSIAFPTIESLDHSGTLNMGVLPEYRRRGIGDRLLESAVSHAFRDGNRWRVQLEVFGDNAAAMALYEKHGFRVEGVARKAVCLDGTFHDVVHMARLKG